MDAGLGFQAPAPGRVGGDAARRPRYCMRACLSFASDTIGAVELGRLGSWEVQKTNAEKHRGVREGFEAIRL